jgi:protein-disulfide isomerase
MPRRTKAETHSVPSTGVRFMTLRRLAEKSSFGWLAVCAIVVVGGALLFFTFNSVLWPSDGANAQSRLSKSEVEQIIHAYLVEHPEVIAEAMQRFEERERAAQASAAKSVLKTHADEVLRDPESPVGGNLEGDVTLVEFFDYNCPYCKRVAPDMAQAEANDPKLRVVYKEFPILGAGSTFAAKAALASHRQGKFVVFHKALMESKGTLTEKGVLEAAGRLGLDVDRLKADMATPAIQAAIDRNLVLARALNINGTPGFLVGEQIVSGAIDLATMERLIGEARNHNK